MSHGSIKKIIIVALNIFILLLAFTNMNYTSVGNINNYSKDNSIRGLINPKLNYVALQWNKTWGGSNSEEGYGITSDGGGNIYYTGYTQSYGASYSDIIILRYDRYGNKQWNKTWGGSGIDEGKDIAYNNSENLYITGYTESHGAGNSDVVLLKYDTSGNLLWYKTWGTSEYEGGDGIAVGNSGGIYITGTMYNPSTNSMDIILLKYNSTGDLQWSQIWGFNNDEYGTDIAIDPSENIYITGYSENTTAGTAEVVLLKYNSAGILSWAKTWSGSFNEGDGIALDSSGNIYITGRTNHFGAGNFDILVLKYDSSGNLLWNKTWGGSAYDEGMGITTDNLGNIYITGYVANYDTYASALVILKYSSVGILEWYEICDYSNLEEGYGIISENSKDLYIIGVTNSFGAGNNDAFLLKYSKVPDPPHLDTISPNPDYDGIIHLNWSDVAGALRYEVYRDTSLITSINGMTPIATIYGDSNYTDSILNSGTYYYVVIAENGTGQSPISNCENVTVILPPNAPILYPITPNPDDDGKINLNWSDVTEATKYYIFRNISIITSVNVLTPIAIVFESHYTDTIFINGTYYYVIVAGNEAGNSSISNCESVSHSSRIL